MQTRPDPSNHVVARLFYPGCPDAAKDARQAYIPHSNYAFGLAKFLTMQMQQWCAFSNPCTSPPQPRDLSPTSQRSIAHTRQTALPGSHTATSSIQQTRAVLCLRPELRACHQALPAVDMNSTQTSPTREPFTRHQSLSFTLKIFHSVSASALMRHQPSKSQAHDDRRALESSPWPMTRPSLRKAATAGGAAQCGEQSHSSSSWPRGARSTLQSLHEPSLAPRRCPCSCSRTASARTASSTRTLPASWRSTASACWPWSTRTASAVRRSPPVPGTPVFMHVMHRSILPLRGCAAQVSEEALLKSNLYIRNLCFKISKGLPAQQLCPAPVHVVAAYHQCGACCVANACMHCEDGGRLCMCTALFHMLRSATFAPDVPPRAWTRYSHPRSAEPPHLHGP